MAKEKKFRLREKPEEPKRVLRRANIEIYDGETLAGIAGKVRADNGNPENGFFEKQYGRYDDPDDICFVFEAMESEKDFQTRCARWKERLREWEKWYQENAEQISRFLAEKELKEAKKGALLIEREKEQLEKRLRALEKLQKRFQQ